MHILKKNLKLVVKPPHLQKYARQIGNHETPGIRGESVKKSLKFHHLDNYTTPAFFGTFKTTTSQHPSHHCPPSDGWKKSDAPQGKERKFRITKPAKMLIKLPLYTKKTHGQTSCPRKK